MRDDNEGLCTNDEGTKDYIAVLPTLIDGYEE